MLSITLYASPQDDTGYTYRFRPLDGLRRALQVAKPWSSYRILGRTDLSDIHDSEIEDVVNEEHAAKSEEDSAEIYTNYDQCDRFEVPYRGEATLTIRADVLLSSKSYDVKHRKLLEPYGSSKLVLIRTGEQSPGWWKIKRSVPPKKTYP